MTHTHTAPLLVELLTEELPPKALARLGDAFAEGLAQRLAARDLIDGEAVFERFATPRRLAVLILNVRAVAPERQVREKVLPVSVALDANGNPTPPPLAKKLAALGRPELGIADLERAQDGKAEAFFLNYSAPGATLADGLQAALKETLDKLPIPKVMTYQRPDGSDVQFVRPVHRLTVLHDTDVVPVSAFGIDAGDTTLGHRFLSSGAVAIGSAAGYAETLRERGRVIAHFVDRKEQIRTALAEQAGGDTVVMPEALLDEVASLVEWPVVYACRFEDEFLQVPQECLILTMQTNQKYFALTDAAGKLRSRFLIVSNIETATPAEIVEGNERVVRPRLADAKFFFETDKKTRLADRVPRLANVVYHNKLGSQLARVERIEAIAAGIAPAIGADPALAQRAARLAKADLLTDMVGEFPELQGTMGTYYARHERRAGRGGRCLHRALPAALLGRHAARGRRQHRGGAGRQARDPGRHLGHRPRADRRKGPVRAAPSRAGRAAPAAREATAARYRRAAARRPGELRRHRRGGRFDRRDLRLLPRSTARPAARARLQRRRDRRGAGPRADPHRRADRAPGRGARVHAPGRGRGAGGRQQADLSNILKKSEGAAPGAIQPALLAEPAEQALAAQLAEVAPRVQSQLAARDYTGALSALAALRAPVDTFFNDVMVNAEDPALRANRLALLSALHQQMNCVADISKLAA